MEWGGNTELPKPDPKPLEVVRIDRYAASNDLLAPHIVLCVNGGVRPQTLFKVQVFNNVIK
jgi:hypothetical protein